MIWFLSFTGLGIMILMIIALMKNMIAIGWKHWLGAVASLGIAAWIVRKKGSERLPDKAL